MNLCIQSGGVFGHYSLEEGYRLLADLGFSSIDLNIDTCFNAGYLKDHMNEGKNPYEKGPEAVIDWYRADIDAIRDAGLYIYQAHAPFPAYRPDAPASFSRNIVEPSPRRLKVSASTRQLLDGLKVVGSRPSAASRICRFIPESMPGDSENLTRDSTAKT